MFSSWSHLLLPFWYLTTTTTAVALNLISLNSSTGLGVSNTSESSNLTIPSLLPHRFTVPNTDLDIRIWFGLLPRSLDLRGIEVLLAVSQDWINQENEERHPSWQLFPMDNHGHQEFGKTLHDGVKLEVWNDHQMAFFTWRALRNFVVGLRLYLVEGQRNYQCYFSFDEGGSTLGRGRLVGDSVNSAKGRR